jgi:NADP-dependent 3-hydroxy acid dehydrogenase YdfG
MFPGSIATNFLDNTPMETHDYMMDPEEVAETVIFLLQRSDNFLINELTLRPLEPKPSN